MVTYGDSLWQSITGKASGKLIVVGQIFERNIYFVAHIDPGA